MDRAAFTGLLTEAAPLLDAQQLTQLGSGDWYLVFDEGQVIDLQWDELVPRIVLAGGIGELPAGSPPTRLELLLAYNALWASHGGLRTALDLESREVSLLLDVPLQALDLQALAAVLANFRAALSAWAEVLRAPAPEAGASTDAIMSGLLGFGAIRG